VLVCIRRAGGYGGTRGLNNKAQRLLLFSCIGNTEQGHAMIYFITRISVSIIFLYHGLVPKLIFKSPQEVLMNDVLMPFVSKEGALLYTGIAEVVYSIALLVFYRSKLLMYPTMVFAVVGTLLLSVTLPDLFKDAFNPFSINLSIFTLALLNVLSQRKPVKIT